MWKWEGDYDILEPRLIVCLIAVAVGYAVCAWYWLALTMAGLGNALA